VARYRNLPERQRFEPCQRPEWIARKQAAIPKRSVEAANDTTFRIAEALSQWLATAGAARVI
jgi:hypothetical protein